MDVDVLIVGAGPTGLALAEELARFGVSFRIVDNGRGVTDLSKAIGVQARTLETLDIMGLADDLARRGNQARSFHIYDGADPILSLDFQGLDSRYPYLLVVPQSDTERVLAGKLNRLGILIEHETTLTHFTQDGQSVSAVVRGADGREQTIHTRWLVGCDGAHSAVRHGLNMPFEGQEYPEGFLLADVAVEWDKPSDELFLFLHEGWLTAFFALPNGRYRIIADLPPDDAPPDQKPALEECQRLVDSRLPISAKLSEPSWTAYYRVHRRIVPRLQDGRVFLVGDAAHIHSPAAAQGMNTGIQDAFNLGWKLALVAQGYASETLLRSYHTERYPVERAVLQGTDLLLRMVSLRKSAGRSLRNHLLPLVSATRPVQERVRERISELSVQYNASPIVLDCDHAGGPKAGERAPDGEMIAPNGASVRIYEILRDGRFLMLIFSDQGDTFDERFVAAALDLPAPLCSLVRRVIVTRREPSLEAMGGDVPVLHDAPGLVYERYGAVRPCVRIIRPDGYIGFRADIRLLKNGLFSFGGHLLGRF